ncbi:hypothetical protein BH20CHL6_BH20CHL6_08220 [soil metagenome]
MSLPRLAIHGHFYQPPRIDPFSGRPLVEPSAAPYRDWTSRITDECYAPNAELANFSRIGWDIGPRLATFLHRERPQVHEQIRLQETGHNGLAQAYHHSILPLASARDRRTEIRWGLRDFELRFGHRPPGLWLPETAVDLLTLRIAAQEGVRYTILAPWQAEGALDTRRPYRVELGGGLEMAVVFYDGGLSASASFEAQTTIDADRFARERILPRIMASPAGRRAAEAPLVLIATDGELYGHHHAFRDLFLARLSGGSLRGSAGKIAEALETGEQALSGPVAGGALNGRVATEHGFRVVTVGDALAETPLGRLPTATIREATSWSCHHGVARWSAECPDAADGRWKQPLRGALDRLAGAIDAVSEGLAQELRIDLWGARDAYADVISEFLAPEEAIAEALRSAAEQAPSQAARLAGRQPRDIAQSLLTAQASRLAMFISDAWFWDDPSRPETAQALRFAGHAARCVDEVAQTTLERGFVEDLAAIRSPGTGHEGVALYAAALAAVDQAPPGSTSISHENAGR